MVKDDLNSSVDVDNLMDKINEMFDLIGGNDGDMNANESTRWIPLKRSRWILIDSV